LRYRHGPFRLPEFEEYVGGVFKLSLPASNARVCPALTREADDASRPSPAIFEQAGNLSTEGAAASSKDRLDARTKQEQSRPSRKEIHMLRALIEDLIELSCLAAFLSGIAVLAHPGFGF
jgi:hypothetical protein